MLLWLSINGIYFYCDDISFRSHLYTSLDVLSGKTGKTGLKPSQARRLKTPVTFARCALRKNRIETLGSPTLEGAYDKNNVSSCII
ncbi:hypothetical protein ACROYT_G043989 [Oculina patagonica]